MSEKKLLTVFEGNVDGHKFQIEFWGGEVAEVTLVDYPANAKDTLARTTRGYTGRYDAGFMSAEEMRDFYQDLKNTKLGTPAEMLNFVFLVRDVPRSWTHQAVRTRIGAAVVQESTRFIGAKDLYKVLVPKTARSSVLGSVDGVDEAYWAGTVDAILNYERILTHPGVASQDARNILPHSLLTHMYWSLTLRALMGIYEVRWCCQAEPSTWIPVMKQMKQHIQDSCGADIAGFLSAPIDRGQSCGFNASFDRPCVWKTRN